MENQCYRISTLIVVSPLKVLMEDQVRKMSDCGVSAVALHDQAIKLAEKIGNVQAGHYSLVYTSPECILSKDIWRSLISSQEFSFILNSTGYIYTCCKLEIIQA